MSKKIDEQTNYEFVSPYNLSNSENQDTTDNQNQTTEYKFKGQSPYSNFDYDRFIEEYQRGEKPLLDILMRNYTPPQQEVTPEQAKRAKFAAALTDSFKTLAEIYGQNKGAYIRNRGNEKTNAQVTNDKLRVIRDKYEQDMMRYNLMKNNAEMKDFLQRLQTEQNKANKQFQWELYNQRKNDNENLARQKAEAQRLVDEEKFKRQKELIKYRSRFKTPRSSTNDDYVDLQNNKGRYVRIPKSTWTNVALDIYGELTRRGLLTKLEQEKKNAFGLPYKEEVLDPSLISAYVAQNAHLIPDDLWDKINLRVKGQPYIEPAKPSNQSAKPTQSTKPSNQSAKPTQSTKPSNQSAKPTQSTNPNTKQNKGRFDHSPY